MSKKTLWTLVALLAALAVASWWNGRRANAPVAETAAAAQRLLPAVDLNAVRAIVLADAAATARVAKVDDVWRVAEMEDAPADVGRLRDLLRAFDEQDDVQLAEAGANTWRITSRARGEPAPLRIELQHDQGTTVLQLGKRREPRNAENMWGAPAGRYARVDEGPVLLLKDDLSLAQAVPDVWWERALLAVPPESVRRVETSGADGACAVARTPTASSSWKRRAGETVDAAAADRLFGALRNLRAAGLLKKAKKKKTCSPPRVLSGGNDRQIPHPTGAGWPTRATPARRRFRSRRPPLRRGAAGGSRANCPEAGRSDVPDSSVSGDAFGAKRETLVRKPEPAPEAPPAPAVEPTPEPAATDAPAPAAEPTPEPPPPEAAAS
jgi:hypothetical protein